MERRQFLSLASGADLTKEGLPATFERFRFQDPSEVLVEVPEAAGVDVYLFAGPTMRLAVQRYNLFAGGGALNAGLTQV